MTKTATPSLTLPACLLAAALGLAAGCGQSARPGEGPGESAPPPRYLGRVAAVNEELGYVIVEGRHLPAAGDRAILLRDGAEAAVVRFTGRTRGTFAAADVTEGTPRIGDEVVRRP